MADEPHRLLKYVEGVYKPHFNDPETQYVLMSASMLPNHHDGGLYWAKTDSDGDTAGVVRRRDETPITEGADMIVGYVYDDDVKLRDGNYVDYNERIDVADIPKQPD